MTNTLDILRKQHQALAEHEAARERKRGPRPPTERERLRTILVAHQQAWLAAGGADAEFLLAPLLAPGSLRTESGDSSPSESSDLAEWHGDPPLLEPVTEEKRKRRERA